MPYALQARVPMLVARNQYWTSDSDYSAEEFLTFKDRAAAERWLHVHGHLRRCLSPVWVETETNAPEASAADRPPPQPSPSAPGEEDVHNRRREQCRSGLR